MQIDTISDVQAKGALSGALLVLSVEHACRLVLPICRLVRIPGQRSSQVSEQLMWQLAHSKERLWSCCCPAQRLRKARSGALMPCWSAQLQLHHRIISTVTAVDAHMSIPMGKSRYWPALAATRQHVATLPLRRPRRKALA